MEQGKVKWFNAEKGFGFIECEDGNEVYVHFTAITDRDKTLIEGDAVEFTIVVDMRGKTAQGVFRTSPRESRHSTNSSEKIVMSNYQAGEIVRISGHMHDNGVDVASLLEGLCGQFGIEIE